MKMKNKIDYQYHKEREMNMKKRLAIVLTVVALISSFTVGVMSQGLIEKIEAEIRGDFTVVIDGKKQTFRDANGNVVEPILYNGTTYLPIRAIGEIMGKTVYWYQDEKRIELVENTGEETLVTDADVIVDAADKTKPVKDKDVVKIDKVQAADVEITLEKAKGLVLKKAGLDEADVVFTKAKLDYDDGRLVYEIDFKTDDTRYDAEVDATNGEIIQWEIEAKKNAANKEQTANAALITLEEAKKVALDKAGLKEKDVVFEEARLDKDDGRQVYDIEFRQGRIEYSFEIDAADGTIIEWEKDND